MIRAFLLLLCLSTTVYAQNIEIAGIDKVGDYDFKNSSLAKSVVDLGCSGTIIVIGKSRAYGVSAAHCATVDAEFSFDGIDGTSGNARWVAVDRENDLALFVCNSEDVKHSTPIIDPIPDRSMWLAAGFPQGNNGKQERKLLKFSNSMTITESGSRRRVPNRNEYNVKEGYVAGGDSGGAVFAVRPQAAVEGLIGVTSHREGDSLLYASNHATLVKFVKSCEPEMAEDCRQNWCYKWNPKPSPERPREVPGPPEVKGPGQHDLPDDVDSDRDRAIIILEMLKRLDSYEQALEKVTSLSAEDIEDLLGRLDDLEKRNRDLESQLANLESRIQNLEKRAPVPGPPGKDGRDGRDGEKGEKGDKGDKGDQGEAATFDEDELIKRLIEQFPDRRVILAKDGKKIDEEKFPVEKAIIIDVRKIVELANE